MASIYHALLLLFLAVVSLQRYECSKNLKEKKSFKPALGDYAFSKDGFRVKGLIGLFETMSNFDTSSNTEKNDVIITLSEAINKLHILSVGYSLEIRCNKYVKLISQPNIRTFSSVNLLMEESRLFNEIEQSGSNLVSQLESERSFDALGRIQTIVQTLESERTASTSNYEPEIQKELLDCMNYYIYRHQKATSEIIQYVRKSLDTLKPSIVEPARNQFITSKIEERVRLIRDLERDGLDKGQNLGVWLKELSDIQNLVVKNNFEIPKLVRDLLLDNERLERLRKLERVGSQAQQLWKSCVSQEILRKTGNKDYRSNLSKLMILVESNISFLGPSLDQFVRDPRRQKIVRDYQTMASEVKPRSLTSGVSVLEKLTDCDENYERLKKDRISPLQENVTLKEALDFARSLNHFNAECLSKSMNNANKSRWSIKLLSRHLYSWLNRKRRTENVTQEDKQELENILAIVREIKF